MLPASILLALAVLFALTHFARRRLTVHACARHGHLVRLRALIEADPRRASAINPEGEQPLHQAAKTGQLMAAALLVERGAPVNARTVRGVTPLHLAAAFGHAALVRYLLEAGADVEAREEAGVTPLMAAQESGHLDLLGALNAPPVRRRTVRERAGGAR
jgi:ankyrin repeat protein